MAKNFNSFPGGVPVTGGIEPAGNFPVVESKYVQVSEDGKSLADVLGSGTGSIAGQISSALEPYSTTSQVKAFNDMANYYTKSQLDGATGKVDKSNIATSVTNSGTDTQVPSAKATYTAIEAAKTAASNNKTDDVTSGSAIPVTSGGVYSKLQDYYTKSQLDSATGKIDKSNIATDVTSSGTDAQVVSAKAAYTAIETAKNAAIEAAKKTETVEENNSDPVTSGGVYSKLQDYYTKDEAGEMFYVAIVINTATLSKATFEQGDTAKTTNFNWSTNTLATSAKITVGSGAATETITDGTKKNSGTYGVTIDTDTVGTNSAAKTVAVKVDVKDAFAGTATKSVNATICNNIILGGAVRYTGSNLAAIMSDTNMSVKKLQGSKSVSTTNVTVNSGKMLTIAIPTGYGNPSFKIDNQDVTLNKKGSAVKYNNQFGKEVTYDIYQMNPNGDDTDLENSNTTHTVQIS